MIDAKNLIPRRCREILNGHRELAFSLEDKIYYFFNTKVTKLSYVCIGVVEFVDIEVRDSNLKYHSYRVALDTLIYEKVS